MKQREIDEKLEKLGIERRADAGPVDAHLMRGRAASVSLIEFPSKLRAIVDPIKIDFFPCRPRTTDL